jgi:hypothetical protein
LTNETKKTGGRIGGSCKRPWNVACGTLCDAFCKKYNELSSHHRLKKLGPESNQGRGSRNGNKCYHQHVKRRQLTDQEIESAHRELLAAARPTVTHGALQAELLRRYGVKGRNDRLLRCIQAERNEPAPNADAHKSRDEELEDLRQRAERAETRAAQAEQGAKLAEERVVAAEARERGNQNFYADRYAEQLMRLEAQHARQPPKGIPVEAYLNACRRAAYYRNRLAVYEKVEGESEVDRSGDVPEGGGS